MFNAGDYAWMAAAGLAAGITLAWAPGWPGWVAVAALLAVVLWRALR